MNYLYYQLQNHFSYEQLDYIENLPKSYQVGTVNNADGIDLHEIRKCNLSWIQDSQLDYWLNRIFIEANGLFGFNISGIRDHVQYTVYDNNDSHYDWHSDNDMTDTTSLNSRKLSLVMLLNDSSEYEGGDFEAEVFKPTKEEFSKKGDLIVFPSFIRHKVHPVTKGTRKTLVAWMEGPRFR